MVDGLAVSCNCPVVVTFKVIGIICGLLAKPLAAMVIEPEYVPTARPSGVTVTVSVTGAPGLTLVTAGETDSQLPPLVVAASGWMTVALVTLTVRD